MTKFDARDPTSQDGLLSVVMPVHNAAPYLDEAIESILNQSYRDFEFVILDDGSTDGSAEKLREWAAKDDRIKLHRQERNSGPVESSNLVVHHASGALIARMDADDRSHPERLQRQVDLLKKQPEIGLVGSLCNVIDRKGRIVRGPDVWRLDGRSWFTPFPHGSIMYRRDLFDRAGGYRKACVYWEDPLRLPKYGAFSFVSKAAGLARGLVSRDPARRLDSGQRLLVYMLWNRPRPEIERHLEFAERINDDALVGSRLWPDRDAMLVAIPKGGAIAEVGVYQGGFSKRIAEVCRPKSLNLIDIDLSALDEAGVRSMLNGATLKTHQGDGAAILSSFADATFDMIYVDADHSYASVAKDIAAAHRALKPGGLMMCNDYTNWCSPSVSPYGVARAVNEFVNREGYDCIGLALHPAGLYDILLRKPPA